MPGAVRRAWWIIVSYLTRPIIWAVVGFAIVMLGIDLFAGRGRSSFMWTYPQPPGPTLQINSRGKLESVRKVRREGEVDAIMLSALWFDMHRNGVEQRKGAPPAARPVQGIPAPTEDYYRVLDEFPNLRQVEYTCFGEPIGFDRVTQLAGVEYLTVDGVCALDFARLSPLRQLRELIVQTSQPPEHVAALAKLPRLETVVFRSRLAINDDVLAELAELPHLKVLVLDFGYQHPSEPRLTKAGFDALASAPALETLYVGGRPEWSDDQIALARAAMADRKVVVEPAVALSAFSPPEFLHFLPFAIFAAVVGAQLSSQFRSPARRLAPGFTASHALVGIGLCVTIAALCAARFVATGTVLASAIAVSAAGIASAVGGTALTSLVPSYEVKGTKWWSLLPSAVGLGLMAMLFHPALSDQVLRHPDRRVLAVLWLAAIACVAATAWALRNLVFWSTSLPITARNAGQPSDMWAGRFREGWWSAGGDREQRIEAWSGRSASDWTWWQRIARWQIGNPPLRMVRLSLFMVAMVLAGQYGILWLAGMSDKVSWSTGLCFAAWMILAQTTMQIAGMWRMRLAVLPLEMTRPVARGALQREWIAAYIADLAPSTAVAAASGALAVNMAAPTAIDWPSLPLDFLILFPAALTLAIGVGSLLIVVRRFWLALLVVFGVIWLTAVALVGMTVVRGGGPGSLTAADFSRQMMEGQSWILAAIGAVLAAFAARRWMRMECA
ncbi:MAG: hypothetical protein HYX69_03555 [Planctomycetia bacterium]|nr:hypothetical protein [Planctomycetia bacterium]